MEVCLHLPGGRCAALEIDEEATMGHIAGRVVEGTGIDRECLSLAVKGVPLAGRDSVKVQDTALEAGDRIDVTCSFAAIVESLRDGRRRLKDCPEWARREAEIVTAALQIEGSTALRDADAVIRDNREVVSAAIALDGTALCEASERLRDDRSLVLAAVQLSWHAYSISSSRCRADREIALAAVSQNGILLRFASDQLKSDREVVLAAVKQNADSLAHAAPHLQGDSEVLGTADVARVEASQSRPWLESPTDFDFFPDADSEPESNDPFLEWLA